LIIAYNNLGKGGIQSQMLGIIRSLKERVDFSIVVWDEAKDYYTPELEQYGVNIIRCFRNIGNHILRRKADAFIRYRDLRRIIADVIQKHGPYDVIHCNNAFDAAPCLEASYKAGIPVRIAHAHNLENPKMRKKLFYPLYRILYAHHRYKIRKYANYMIGCSKQVTDYSFGKDRGKVVHIGIELSSFQSVPLSGELPAATELLHVGGMHDKKNQLFLVDIMEELQKYRKNVHLTMIGDGDEYLDRVKSRINEKQLGKCISIMPSDTDVAQAMAKADLLVFPSISEGFGIVLIEAQATGLPCIVSDIVSREADCGGVQYYPLAEGAANWAEMIHRKIEDGLSHERKYDVSEFSVGNMSRCMYEIYISQNEVNT